MVRTFSPSNTFSAIDRSMFLALSCEIWRELVSCGTRVWSFLLIWRETLLKSMTEIWTVKLNLQLLNRQEQELPVVSQNCSNDGFLPSSLPITYGALPSLNYETVDLRGNKYLDCSSIPGGQNSISLTTDGGQITPIEQIHFILLYHWPGIIYILSY